jgi:hypothetical protein
MKTTRELAKGKTRSAEIIVSFLKEEKKGIQEFFWDIDFNEVDFHGCSVPYVQEKVELLIDYLKFINKSLGKTKD